MAQSRPPFPLWRHQCSLDRSDEATAQVVQAVRLLVNSGVRDE